MSIVIHGSENLVSEAREVKDFDKVVLAGFGSLNIVQAEKESLMVEADEEIMPLIVTEVRDGTLYIEMKKHVTHIHIPTDITYSLTVSKLDEIDLTGAGKITVFPLDVEHLRFNMSGAGKVKFHKCPVDSFVLSGAGMVEALNIDVPELNITISGAAHLRVTGKADHQSVRIPGAGNYSGERLESKSSEVTLSGTGRAAVTATETLDATINGAGVISYGGNPTVTKRVRGFGSIHKR